MSVCVMDHLPVSQLHLWEKEEWWCEAVFTFLARRRMKYQLYSPSLGHFHISAAHTSKHSSYWRYSSHSTPIRPPTWTRALVERAHRSFFVCSVCAGKPPGFTRGVSRGWRVLEMSTDWRVSAWAGLVIRRTEETEYKITTLTGFQITCPC